MKPCKAEVIIIRGAPGAGKSQAARSLARFFPAGAKLEVDALRKMVFSVNWTSQEEHKAFLQVAARLVHDYIKMGFRPVIVVDTFSGDKVDGFLDTLRGLAPSLSASIFGLYVSEDVLKRRLETRPAGEFTDFAISRRLNADVLKLKHVTERQIDTSVLSPEQTAGIIHKFVP